MSDIATLLPASTELAPPKASALAAAGVGRFGIQLNTFDGLWAFAQCLSRSGLAPKGIEKPEAITIALQMGMELGLPPMAALQNIAVINGRPSLWGDAQLAVCRGTGELEEFSEWYEKAGKRLARNPTDFADDVAAVCRVKRRSGEVQEQSFSVADAKKASLWGKTGPWSQYPARMLRFRARSFTLRDTFGDALRGLLSAEEVRDLPLTVSQGPAIEDAQATTGAASLNRRIIRAAVLVAHEPPAEEPVDVDPNQSTTWNEASPEVQTWSAAEACAFGVLTGEDRNIEPEVAKSVIAKSKTAVDQLTSAKREGRIARVRWLNAIADGRIDPDTGGIGIIEPPAQDVS